MKVKFRNSDKYRGIGRPRKSDYDFFTLRQLGRMARRTIEKAAIKAFNGAFNGDGNYLKQADPKDWKLKQGDFTT